MTRFPSQLANDWEYASSPRRPGRDVIEWERQVKNALVATDKDVHARTGHVDCGEYSYQCSSTSSGNDPTILRSEIFAAELEGTCIEHMGTCNGNR